MGPFGLTAFQPRPKVEIMGALPTKKVTRAQGGRKKIAYRMKPVHPSRCPQCRAAKASHRACAHCGYYKGRKVVPTRGEPEEN